MFKENRKNNEDLMKNILASAQLPARMKPEEVAQFLGFQKWDIPVLIKKKLLNPLAKPNQQATKYFALVDILECASKPCWLAKATQAGYDHWEKNNKNKKAA